MKLSTFTSLICALIYLISCSVDQQKLPILGRMNIEGTDTILHKIPKFNFINQDSNYVTNQDLEPYIYVSDFFFISCPSICPLVKKQMLRVYEKYKDNPKIKMVSHTIDPKRDTPKKLSKYAEKLKIDTDKWMFLTGDKGEILDIADDYFVAAFEDADAPGGFDHSGKIILTDTKGHIRAFAEGTDSDDVTDFLKDIDLLLKEYE
ncbi:MAG: SCO family protein [Saprospiraceae bacterium]|nr:SCO family protein [Bacteroidia bacterium]NNE15537.1 SCO family protein [Saprospiraceae bacterium]NNL93040.1 SCO family protein [Saprospiraceae bacterium]